MLLRQMKYFAAVVECGSFTEAAEQCYISQSAISQQIRILEEELGVELLHRRNRKFTVTTAGEYFYSQCRAVLAQVEELMQETRRLGTDRELQLRIGYLRCYSGLELHQAVAEFSKIYPEISSAGFRSIREIVRLCAITVLSGGRSRQIIISRSLQIRSKSFWKNEKMNNRKVSPAELLYSGSVRIPAGILFSFYICSLKAFRLPQRAASFTHLFKVSGSVSASIR